MAQFASLCHLSVSTLSRMETGQRKLGDVHYLHKLSDILAIPPHLFGLTPTDSGAPKTRESA